MYVALCGDLLHANAHALAEWLVVYPASTGYFNTALADTFGTPAFLVDFTAPLSSMPTIEAVVKASSSSSSSKADTSTTLAHLYAGVRQDSGDPAVFIRRVVAAYKRAGIDPADKAIIFSDSLTVDRCIAIRDMCAADSADIESGGGGGIQAKFGIGTHFTNDFQKRVDVNSGNDTMTAATTTNTKSPAMDIVVKLFQVDGKHVVKLSDNPSGKFQGDSAAVDLALKTFGVNLDL